jgi:hypothetical protein
LQYHTDTTACYVGSNHDGGLSGLELVQNPVTLVLLLVSVNGKAGPSILSKEAGDLVGGSLGSSEDQALALLVVHDLLEVLDQTVTL